MRHTRTWLFVFLPFFYVAIVFGLIAVQFSKKSDTFSQSLGDLTVSGKSAQGSQSTELTLRGRGLVFSFDATHVLVAETSEGTTTRLRPQSWAWKDGNILVTFQQGLQLAVEKADGGRSLLLHPVANEASQRFRTLRIPFAPANGGRLSVSPRGTFMEVTHDKVKMIASVDGPLDRIEADHTFVLNSSGQASGKVGFRSVRIDPLAPGVPADLAWLTVDNSATVQSAEAALNQYWDRAYANWPRTTTFSTSLVNAWSREALRRGDYPSAFSRMQSLLGQDRKAWGFEAAAALGNVVELTIQHRRAVEAASSRTQPDWAGQGRLWLNAAYYGPEGSSNRVKSLLLEGNLPSQTAGLSAVLENLMALQAREPSEAVTLRLQEVVRALLPKVIRRDGELFVANGGLLDLRQGLIVGRLWLDYSRTLANEAFAAAGSQLISSALARLDSSGRLPEFLVVQDGIVVRQEGQILPEDLYRTVRPEVPAETPLPEWGVGAFLRTPATVANVRIGESQARFGFRFPVGSAQHIVIAGVPPFDHITLHGIRWRTDPQFQSYTDGWYYSASTKTLYLKIKHREDLEELIVHFQPEQ